MGDRSCFHDCSDCDSVWDWSPLILYSSLGLGLKACTTTLQPLWINSVASGIKCVCYHCPTCMADLCDCFAFWSSRKHYLLKHKLYHYKNPWHLNSAISSISYLWSNAPDYLSCTLSIPWVRKTGIDTRPNKAKVATGNTEAVQHQRTLISGVL